MTSESASKEIPVAELGLDAWRNLLLAQSRLVRALDQELQERHDFALGDYDVFVNLARAPGERLRMCDLAEAVVLSPSGLTRRVDRLERAGFVRRERAATDARNVEAALTPAGQRLFKRLRATHHDGVHRRFAANFSEHELDELRELLGRLSDSG